MASARHGDGLHARLHRALTDARRSGDTAARAALRTAMAILDNAATVDPPAAPAPSRLGVPSTGGAIAGARAGAGSTEADRRVVTEAEARALLEADLVERREAMAQAEHAGRVDLVDRMRAELEALEQILG